MNFREWMHQTWKVVGERPYPQTHYTQTDVDLVLRAAVEALLDELEDGGELYLTDLGRLSAQQRPARTVVSHVGEGERRYQIPARWAVVFNPSKALTRRLNEKRG